MKPLTSLGAALLVIMLLPGCAATQKLLSMAQDFAVGVYKATSYQIHLADQRATAFFDRLPSHKKEELEESGTRYLAVRTADPTPAQMVKIRNDMKKPGSRYGGTAAAAAPRKIYCVMIWDTQTREVVGTDCYAAVRLPQADQLARFDTYTAQYVGTF